MTENDRDKRPDAPEDAPEGEASAKEAADKEAPEKESDRAGSHQETSEEPAAGGDEEAAAAAKKKAAAAAKAKAAAEAKKKAAEEEAKKPPWERDPAEPEWRDEDTDELVRRLREAHPDAVTGARSYAEDLVLSVTREGVLGVAKSLKEEHGFRYMVDVAGVDYPDRDERFEVVYHVYDHSTERRVRLKVATDEETPVPSLTPVWRGCNWPEREAYDMYGIRFDGHPDLTRILLWEGFNGYPLRKDFPVEGIDTGSAIYPEYYAEEQGPISGTGTGWKVPQPPEPAAEEEVDEPGEGGGAAGPEESS